MANMLNAHVDPTLLCKYTKIHPTAMSTSSVIAKYVLETNMPIKLGVYAKYLTCIYR